MLFKFDNLTFRDYQRKAINNTINFILQSDQVRNPIVVAPTGAGKTYILTGICLSWFQLNANPNILILSHTKKVLSQDYNKLLQFFPKDQVGLYSASLKSRKIKNITVAGIQSIHNKPDLLNDFNLVIVDEAHLVNQSEEDTTYTKLLKKFHRSVPIIALTATPFRLNIRNLTEGFIFDKIVYEITLPFLIDQGWLVPFTTTSAKKQLDLSKVKVVGSDYSKKSLSQNIDRTNITTEVCKELVLYKESRKFWLIFAIDIDHAEHISETLNSYGINTLSIHSRQDDSDQDIYFSLFEKDHIQALVNVGSLTTGFDSIKIDLVVLLRPTLSPVLHVQMPGRGARPDFPEGYLLETKEQRKLAIAESSKPDCCLLDFAGNFERLGPIDRPDFKVVGGSKVGGKAPTKVCPACNEVLLLSDKQCLKCGHKFETQEKISAFSSTHKVLSTEKRPFQTYNVRKVFYSLFMKKGMPSAMRVTYRCQGLKVISELLFISNHRHRGGFIKWWKDRTDTPVPATTEEAMHLVGTLIAPAKIQVDPNGKYPKVVRYYFKE